MADYTTAQRQAMADKGWALPDLSFPIATKQDLANAIMLLGHAKDPQAAKRLIVKRARDLGAVDLLPKSWGITK